jgi:hypothetical protein
MKTEISFPAHKSPGMDPMLNQKVQGKGKGKVKVLPITGLCGLEGE